MGREEGQPSAGSPRTLGTTLSQAWWGLKEIAPEDPGARVGGAAGKRASFFCTSRLSGLFKLKVLHSQGADDTLIEGLVPADQWPWLCPVIAQPYKVSDVY